jgi:hypothetical protein
VSHLVVELALRLAKAIAATIAGLVLYLLLVGPAGQPPSVMLALLSWLAGAAFVLLVESSPI